MDKNYLIKKIIDTIESVAEDFELTVVKDLNENTVLLDCGIDSLGFAVVVAKLEEDLGYDPFVLMEESVYPKTLIELVEIYERYSE
tara:strand:+ start:26 stop:283 length:258 start_codon:yes stop_codon:yes gene_type:complete